jgi:multidrug efflux system membrane fusion protein
MKRILIVLLLLGVVGAGGLAYREFDLGSWTTTKAAAQPRPQTPRVPVLTANVVKKAAPVRIDTIGTVQPLASVAIRSRVDGLIMKVHFREGQDVKAGDVLFTLDARAVEATLRQSEAQNARDRAQLANARREVERQQELAAKNFTSGAKFDEMRTNAQALESTVRAGEAAIEITRVVLSHHTIVSPINGRTGAVALKAGNTVKANEGTGLVTINQIHPLYVAFSVPQRDLAEVREAWRVRKLEAVVQPVGEETPPERGELAFVDNQIDAATGTITLKATFTNDAERLWPGQFVNVQLTLRVDEDALTIPAPAIQQGQSGTFVYVIKGDQTAEPRNVKVARTLGDEVVVSQGLAQGEQVVVDGQLRLTKGSRVDAKPYTGKAPTS